jgi:hypothetical protein
MKFRPMFVNEFVCSVLALSLFLAGIAVLDSGCHSRPASTQSSFDIDDAPVAESGYGGAPRSGSWHSKRGYHLGDNPDCAMLGCDTIGVPASARKPNEVHHKIPVEWARKVGHPWLELCDANFITACRKHHISVGHCNNTKRFNLDSQNDMLQGNVNSRGISTWPGDSEMEAFLKWSLGPPRDDEPDDLPLVVTDPYAAWMAWQYIKDEIKK